jgi:hypothetical protein
MHARLRRFRRAFEVTRVARKRKLLRVLSGAIGLYWLWKIVRTPGEL